MSNYAKLQLRSILKQFRKVRGNFFLCIQDAVAWLVSVAPMVHGVYTVDSAACLEKMLFYSVSRGHGIQKQVTNNSGCNCERILPCTHIIQDLDTRECANTF